MGKWQAHPGLSRANIRAAIDGSLRRLRTDYVDIYYAHEDDERVAQSEYLEAFDELAKAGKVRVLLGASNFGPERLSSALAFSRQHGLAAFEVSQDQWNLLRARDRDDARADPREGGAQGASLLRAGLGVS